MNVLKLGTSPKGSINASEVFRAVAISAILALIYGLYPILDAGHLPTTAQMGQVGMTTLKVSLGLVAHIMSSGPSPFPEIPPVVKPMESQTETQSQPNP